MNNLKIWLTGDKAKHFGVCMLIVLASAWIFGEIAAAAFAIAVGLGKELYDKHDYGLFDWWDILADVAGALTGAAVVYGWCWIY